MMSDRDTREEKNVTMKEMMAIHYPDLRLNTNTRKAGRRVFGALVCAVLLLVVVCAGEAEGA